MKKRLDFNRLFPQKRSVPREEADLLVAVPLWTRLESGRLLAALRPLARGARFAGVFFGFVAACMAGPRNARCSI